MVKEISELSWMIGGPQGSGVDSSANTFAQVLARNGYFIYGKREYHSNIKGAHSYYQIMASTKPVNSSIDGVHILATFDDETIHLHTFEILKDGALLLDSEYKGDITRDDILVVKIPYVQIIREIGEKFGERDILKLMVMKNVISVAVSLGLIGIDFIYFEKALKSIFSGRRAKLAPMNIDCGKISYEYGKKQCKEYLYTLKKAPTDFINRRVLTTGNTTIAIAKVAAGCRFQSYYPITPASDESVYLEDHPEYGIVVVQTEDEIAAIASAIGASISGARSSTSTSGPGFCLMAEGIGWAGMNEVPVVVVNYQRGGPSTGLPTRNEQADMRFALHIGHGEFPRIVISPGDIEDAFYDTIDAFNYAEKYQLPVILLTDRAIANTLQTVPIFNPKNTIIDR
ncbi:MAG: 2-oxoacid:acceptor oxidoreductase family protein, partial [Planctomycetota bacterium]